MLIFSYILFATLFVLKGKCQIKCGINCLNCNENDSCLNCKNPYVVNDKGICQNTTLIQGCRVYYSQGKNQCFYCLSGMALVKGKCMKLPDNCDQLDELFQCKKCIEGYFLIGRECLSKNLQNCPSGTFPYQNYCKPYPIQNCLKKQKQICQTCQNKYHLINGVCFPFQCQFTPCINCSCKGALFNKTCISCKPYNCLYSPNNLHCILCQPTYTLVDGHCYKPVKTDDINCNVIDIKNQICSGCNQDFRLNRNSYCVRDFAVQNCQSSEKLFDYFQGVCYYKDRHCLRINVTNYQCIWCQQGYDLRAGKCEKSEKCYIRSKGECIECFPQFYLNPYKKICEQKPKNCFNFSRQSGQCIKCQQRTSLINLTLNKKPICAYIQQRCIEYNYYGNCVTCQKGYFLKNMFCISNAKFCNITNPIDQTLCLICLKGYRLQDSKCYQNIQHCFKYDSNGNCSLCRKDYIVFKGWCIYVDKYCLQSNQEGNCIKCGQGLVPYGNKCVLFQHYCITYGPDRICNQTYNTYQLNANVSSESKQQYRLFILSSKKINQNIHKLTTITQKKQKRQSDSRGYYTQSGKIQFYPTLTVHSNSIKTIKTKFMISQCQLSYFLHPNNICIKNEVKDQYCIQYSLVITEQCIACQKGYDLNAQSKCQIRSEKSCADRKLNKQLCVKCNTVNQYINAGGWCISRQINRKNDSKHFQIVHLKIFWPLLPNCQIQKQILKCQTCLFGFTNIQGKCVFYQKYCHIYHPLGFCQNCVNGYDFQGGNCVPNNCLKQNNFTCISCKSGYLLQGDKCVMNSYQNCLIYQDGNCILCQYQYFIHPRTKKCEKSLPNCAVMNTSTMLCKQCKQQYILLRDRCTLQVSHCIEYSTDNKCLACLSNSIHKYQLLQNNTCIKVSLRCNKMNPTSNQCQSCDEGYNLFKFENTTQCVVFRKNCQVYDRTGRCANCVNNYTLKNSLCQPINYNLNCEKINKNIKKCEKCLHGYNLSENGLCFISISYCKQYKNQKCINCFEEYYLKAQVCQKNPQNCLNYSAKDDKCITCQSKYFIVGEKCIQRNLIFNGCFNKQSSTPNCLACQNGFILKENLCYATNCLTFTSERNCLQCPKYYIKSRKDLRLCVPHFCESYSSGISCQKYQKNYIGGFKIHHSGRIQIQFCKKYDQNNNCIQCEDYRHPKVVNNYSICLPFNCVNQTQFSCQKCKSGFQLIQFKSGNCLSKFCQQYEINGSCKSCVKSYIKGEDGLCLFNSYCKQFSSHIHNRCIKCFDYFTLVESTKNNWICVAYFCLQWNKITGQCLKCPINFSLKQGKCINNHCLIFKSEQQYKSNDCMQCIPGFQPYLQYCIPIYCKKDSYNLTSQHCLTCANGFKANSKGLCVNDNCDKYQATKQLSFLCQKCKRGHSFKNNICQPNHCNQYQNKYLKCKNCIDGFYLSQDICIAANCNQYNEKDECKKCDKMFQIQSNLTCKRKNCVVDTLQYCLKCQNGYYANKQFKGFCIPNNCYKLNAEIQKCQQCDEGYFLTSQKFCNLTVIANCEQQNKTQCIRCKNDFVKISGQCIESDNGCYLRKDNKCMLCKQNYTKIGNKCTQTKSLCIQKDVRGNCLLCRNGTHITYDGFCLVNPDNCLEAGLAGFCRKCQKGYVLSEDYSCIQNPDKPNKQQQNEQQKVANTQNINKQADELSSIPQQLQDEPQQSSSYIDNCLIQDYIQQICTICISDYYITQKGRCLPVPQNCKFVNSKGQCLNCNDGFILKNNACIEDSSNFNSYKTQQYQNMNKKANNLRNQQKN